MNREPKGLRRSMRSCITTFLLFFVKKQPCSPKSTPTPFRRRNSMSFDQSGGVMALDPDEVETAPAAKTLDPSEVEDAPGQSAMQSSDATSQQTTPETTPGSGSMYEANAPNT